MLSAREWLVRSKAFRNGLDREANQSLAIRTGGFCNVMVRDIVLVMRGATVKTSLVGKFSQTWQNVSGNGKGSCLCFLGAVITNYHQLGDLKIMKLASYSSGGQRSEIKVPEGPCSP